MTISTYQELDAAVDRWLKRADLTDRIAEFIQLAEPRIWYGDEDEQYGCEPLRVRQMETSADLTMSGQTVALPSGFLEAVRLYLRSQGENKTVQYLPRTDFWSRAGSNQAGPPEFFTIEGENLVFGPYGSGTGKILYYQKPDALDETDPGSTNAVLTSHPMVYLSATLLEAHLYLLDEERAAMWARRLRGAIGGWNASSRNDRAGTSLRMVPEVVV